MNLQRIKGWLPLLTLILLTLIVGAINPTFLQPQSLLSLAGDIVPLFVMALGMTFVIYIGGIDLSSEAMANLITVIASVWLAGLGGWVALLCILVGVALGAFSGLVTARLLVPSFVSTLAVGGIAYSLAQWLSGQRALFMDAGQRGDTFGWMIGRTAGIPNELFIAAVLLLLCLFIERRTTLGRILKAVGANELAAGASGVNVRRAKVLAFALSGGLAAIAGLIFAVKLSGGGPHIANGFLLPAIVAVLVGGTPLTGGVGGVLNTLVGTLIVAVIRASMLYLDVDATQQQMVFGLVLIAAIAFTIDRSKLRIVK